MNAFSNTIVHIFVVLVLFGFALGDRSQDVSIRFEDKENQRHLALSIEEARVAIDECPVCAEPEEEKSLFATFLNAITNLFKRIGNGLMRWLQGEPESEYSVDHDVLPVFSNVSQQLTTLSERLQLQAVGFENKGLPEVVPWAYRSSAANTQALASYVDNLIVELSADGATTIDSDTVECHISRVTDFVLRNTLPNIIILMETFLEAKDAWIPNDKDMATSTTMSISSNLQSLYPSGNDNVQCLADEEAVEASVVLTSDAAKSERFFFPLHTRHRRVQTDYGLGPLLYLWILLGPVFWPLFFVFLALVNIPRVLITLPFAIVGAIVGAVLEFIRSLLGITAGVVSGVADEIDPNAEGADAWALLVEVLQASPLTSSGVAASQQRLGPELQCEAEALMCRFEAWQHAIPSF